MTVYIICQKLSGHGGIETVLSILINQLESKDVSVVLYIRDVPQYMKWLTVLKQDRLHIIFGNKYNELFILTRLFASAKNDSRFLVASTSRVSIIGLMIRRILGRKWLLYHWPHFSLNMSNNYAYLNKCDGVLAISSPIVQQLKHSGIDSQKIHLVYNPSANEKLSTLKQETTIKRYIYIGRLEDNQKNVSELFEALGMIKSQRGNIILDVYGDGKDRIKYKKLCKKLGLENIVVWHGWKNNVWDYLKFRPNALVLPSRFEGFPMILLEAMSRGIPCITSNFLGYSDIIIDGINGYHYHLGSPSELAKILEKFNSQDFPAKTIMNSIEKFNQVQYFARFSKAIRINLSNH